MKHRVLITLFALMAVLMMVSPVFAYIYRASYTVVSENTTDFEMLGVYTDNGVNNQWMADNGFFNSTANDTRIETLGGLEQPHMVTDNNTFTAIPVPANSQTNLYFTTGNSEQDFCIIPGDGGSVAVADNTTTELGDNFTVAHNGWVAPASDNTDTYLDFVRANSDWVSIPDHANLDFTDGADTDGAATLIAWVNLDDATSSTFLAKSTAVGNQNGWIFFTTAADELELICQNNTQAERIGRKTAAANVTPCEGQWTHFAATYDASETSAGINLYINGVDVDTANVEALPYNGMDDTTAVLELGSYNAGTVFYLDGKMAEAKIYTVELTPAEVLADFNGGHRVADLEAWHRLDDGDGNPQDSANTHHATANLADWETGTGYTYLGYLVKKPGAFYISVDDGDITGWIHGQTSVTATGASGAYRSVTVGAQGELSLVSEDDFDADNWVDVGARIVVVVGNSRLEYDSEREVADQRTSLDLASISDTEWRLDCTWDMTSEAGAGTSVFNFGVVESPANINAYPDDSIGIRLTNTGASLWCTDEGGLTTGSVINIVHGTTYYVTLERTADVSATLNIFSDAARTTHIAGSPDVLAIPATIVGLRYVQASNYNSASAGDIQVGWIDDLEIYDGYSFYIMIDGVIEDAVTLDGASVPDNTNDWTFLQNNVMPYADNITITVGGNLELWFQPNDIISGTTLPDRATSVANDGTFTFGSNPDGVSVTMGGLVSASQPSPGLVIDDPTPDIMPGVEVTDWYIEPDVTGALLTNPLRPFVTILSDTTTLTELQAWRLLGTALWLMVTVATAKAVRGHHAITGIASGACVFGLVILTIYPMWALVFTAVAVITGLISERTPSV